MKEVIISTDGDSMVYLVPDEVADNLRKYCIFFADKWMKRSPNDKKFKLMVFGVLTKQILLTI